MTLADAPMSQSAPDTLDQRDAQADQSRQSKWTRVNVGGNERKLSVAAGGLLALLGVSRRSIPGLILAGVGGGLIYRGFSGHCPVYQALELDTSDEPQTASPEDFFERGIHVEVAFTINKLPWELYEYWRNFENLPKIMSHLESVTVIDERRSRWVAKAPSIAGGKVEWDAEIINDEPNALIAWRSLPNADVDNAGSVRFVPASGDRGTEVKVVIDYIPPAGVVGKWVARLFGEEPTQQITEDLRKFKRVMETGEFATTKGQPRGTCGGCGEREE
jgi:uncharacterized membrane protein